MPDTLTRRQKTILAALAAENAPPFAPVQVQKLFFLLDENLNVRLGGRLFNFQPYNYGPFDAAVYRELEALWQMGLVTIAAVGGSGRREYRLTPAGFTAGNVVLDAFPEITRKYVATISAWVRSMSFQALVGSIYRAYPAMRENSIFEDS